MDPVARPRLRPCPYCGTPTEAVACPSHLALAKIDREQLGAGPPLTEAELAGEVEVCTAPETRLDSDG